MQDLNVELTGCGDCLVSDTVQADRRDAKSPPKQECGVEQSVISSRSSLRISYYSFGIANIGKSNQPLSQ